MCWQRCTSKIVFAMAVTVVMASCASSVAVESTTSAVPTVVPAADSVNDAEPETSTASTTPATSTTVAPMTAEECAAEVSLEVRLGQLLFPVVVQDELEAAAQLAERGLIGGVVVLGSPTEAIAAQIADLQDRSLVSPSIVAVDEEGGRVQRLDSLVGSIPSARQVSAELTLEEARELARSHAQSIGELGFTMNLAPVLDLDNGGFIGDRSFGEDVDLVTNYAFATADGIIAAGLTPVAKHFPGHGRGADSHTGLPTLPDLDTLLESDLVPFIRAVDRGDIPIMIGHLVVPGLTNDKPATLSPEAIDGLLRRELGFDGLVMTDALNMDAISATTNNADAAEQALMAGVDLAMLGQLSDVEPALDQLIDAVRSGRLEEATVNTSFVRVLEHRGIELCGLVPALLPAIGCRSGVGGCSG
jgi:beta-N-acetylhexosaminidase